MTHAPLPRAWPLILAACLANAACAGQPPISSAAGMPDAGANADTDPAHARIAWVLREGVDAQARGRDGADALLSAANRLLALGARPADDGTDLGSQWRQQALAAGARPTAPPLRGRALGAAYSRGNLAAGARSATRQVFLAGQAASVTVVPLSGQAIKVAIAPERKAGVCSRRATRPQASCRWTPDFTERYVIELANDGGQPADYFLIVN